jgi:EAL domain-containing protein (putative c-di-GMP-specific phosphodiesterase class I)/ActR/RegA family two-component response regulator
MTASLALQTRTILLVDDDELQLTILSIQLANLGYHDVIRTRGGEEALAEFDRHGAKIDVIISDLAMPDMDGVVLMRHLAQRGFAKSFILISNITDDILSSAAGLAQAHHLDLLGVLSKPCAPDSLRTLLAARQPRSGGLSAARIDETLTPQRLCQALAAGEFVPWYQPKVDIDSGKAVGAEALARWPVESEGMIGPARFVPAIERAGLSDQLFFAIARAVLADLAVWRSQGILIKAAVNMSMDTALNLAMPEQLLQMVHAVGLQPSDLIIEVTESRLMIERSLAMETLTRLSLMGFVLSIDDFGTGFSSLAQLVDLPFKELKIDGSFVQRANTERKAEAILRISLTIGLTLGMGVVAEGVETAEQVAFIRQCGGTVVQGYHIARPMTFDDCTAWLQRSPVASS